MSQKSKKTFVIDTSKLLKTKQNSKASTSSSTRKYIMYDCNSCQGRKVNLCTKAAHMKERDTETRSLIESSNTPIGESTSRSLDFPDNPIDTDIDETEIRTDNPIDYMDIDERNNDNSGNEQEFDFLTTKPKRSKEKQKQSRGRDSNRYPLVVVFSNSDEEQDVIEEDIISSEDELEDAGEDDNSEQPVNFNAPESGYDDKTGEIPITDVNQGFTWIIYWIFKYQERYRLSDTATDSLIKFIRYILVLIDKNTYLNFLTSLYMARKLLGIYDHIIKYATCGKCCKLYTVKELPTNKPYQCTFKEFPNHPMTKLRTACNADITKMVPTKQGIIYQPSIIFPIADIKRQLQRLYNTKGFEKSCRK